ncbi:MAG: rhomboid family intramembrane serine protease [Phycisphaerae bacterium]
MSWQEREYSTGPGYGPATGHGGLGSWVGGLPPAGRAVKWIALANAILFVLCKLTGGYGSPIYEALAMRTDLFFDGQIWRIFTFTYLHDQTGLWHILFNMLGLYMLGSPLDRRWGAKRFFVFYTLGGFVAVLLYVVMTSIGPLDPRVPLVGASGGVLAVLGACAVLFPQFRLILVFFPVPIRTAVLIFVVIYTFNLTTGGHNAGGDACHLAGLAFGVYFGYRGEGWMRRIARWQERTRQVTWEARRREVLERDQRVDRILEKVNREGIASLSRKEKKLLADATREQQTSDRKHGL